MKKSSRLLLLLSVMLSMQISAQQFLPIWDNQIPNSKGISIKDSIANERIYQVAIPGIYVFEPSKAENKHAAVLIIPGGGYARLAYQISGFQLAKWFNTIGITAFVLNHRFPQSPDVIDSYKAPLQDAQRAMKYIRSRASEWDIDHTKIGAMGSSAGGHLAACLSTIKEDWAVVGDKIDSYPSTPNFTVLISPVITMDQEYVHKGSRNNLLGQNPSEELLTMFSCEKQVDTDSPPAFLVHASNDRSVPAINSILYYSALLKNGNTKSSLHIFPEGGHSIALRNNPGTTNYWTALAEKWLYEIGIIE